MSSNTSELARTKCSVADALLAKCFLVVDAKGSSGWHSKLGRNYPEEEWIDGMGLESHEDAKHLVGPGSSSPPPHLAYMNETDVVSSQVEDICGKGGLEDLSGELLDRIVAFCSPEEWAVLPQVCQKLQQHVPVKSPTFWWRRWRDEVCGERGFGGLLVESLKEPEPFTWTCVLGPSSSGCCRNSQSVFSLIRPPSGKNLLAEGKRNSGKEHYLCGVSDRGIACITRTDEDSCCSGKEMRGLETTSSTCPRRNKYDSKSSNRILLYTHLRADKEELMLGTKSTPPISIHKLMMWCTTISSDVPPRHCESHFSCPTVQQSLEACRLKQIEKNMTHARLFESFCPSPVSEEKSETKRRRVKSSGENKGNNGWRTIANSTPSYIWGSSVLEVLCHIPDKKREKQLKEWLGYHYHYRYVQNKNWMKLEPSPDCTPKEEEQRNNRGETLVMEGGHQKEEADEDYQKNHCRKGGKVNGNKEKAILVKWSQWIRYSPKKYYEAIVLLQNWKKGFEKLHQDYQERASVEKVLKRETRLPRLQSSSISPHYNHHPNPLSSRVKVQGDEKIDDVTVESGEKPEKEDCPSSSPTVGRPQRHSSDNNEKEYNSSVSVIEELNRLRESLNHSLSRSVSPHHYASSASPIVSSSSPLWSRGRVVMSLSSLTCPSGYSPSTTFVSRNESHSLNSKLRSTLSMTTRAAVAGNETSAPIHPYSRRWRGSNATGATGTGTTRMPNTPTASSNVCGSDSGSSGKAKWRESIDQAIRSFYESLVQLSQVLPPESPLVEVARSTVASSPHFTPLPSEHSPVASGCHVRGEDPQGSYSVNTDHSIHLLNEDNQDDDTVLGDGVDAAFLSSAGNNESSSVSEEEVHGGEKRLHGAPLSPSSASSFGSPAHSPECSSPSQGSTKRTPSTGHGMREGMIIGIGKKRGEKQENEEGSVRGERSSFPVQKRLSLSLGETTKTDSTCREENIKRNFKDIVVPPEFPSSSGVGPLMTSVMRQVSMCWTVNPILPSSSSSSSSSNQQTILSDAVSESRRPWNKGIEKSRRRKGDGGGGNYGNDDENLPSPPTTRCFSEPLAFSRHPSCILKGKESNGEYDEVEAFCPNDKKKSIPNVVSRQEESNDRSPQPSTVNPSHLQKGMPQSLPIICTMPELLSSPSASFSCTPAPDPSVCLRFPSSPSPLSSAGAKQPPITPSDMPFSLTSSCGQKAEGDRVLPAFTLLNSCLASAGQTLAHPSSSGTRGSRKAPTREVEEVIKKKKGKSNTSTGDNEQSEASSSHPRATSENTSSKFESFLSQRERAPTLLSPPSSVPDGGQDPVIHSYNSNRRYHHHRGSRHRRHHSQESSPPFISKHSPAPSSSSVISTLSVASTARSSSSAAASVSSDSNWSSSSPSREYGEHDVPHFCDLYKKHAKRHLPSSTPPSATFSDRPPESNRMKNGIPPRSPLPSSFSGYPRISDGMRKSTRNEHGGSSRMDREDKSRNISCSSPNSKTSSEHSISCSDEDEENSEEDGWCIMHPHYEYVNHNKQANENPSTPLSAGSIMNRPPSLRVGVSPLEVCIHAGIECFWEEGYMECFRCNPALSSSSPSVSGHCCSGKEVPQESAPGDDHAPPSHVHQQGSSQTNILWSEPERDHSTVSQTMEKGNHVGEDVKAQRGGKGDEMCPSNIFQFLPSSPSFYSPDSSSFGYSISLFEWTHLFNKEQQLQLHNFVKGEMPRRSQGIERTQKKASSSSLAESGQRSIGMGNAVGEGGSQHVAVGHPSSPHSRDSTSSSSYHPSGASVWGSSNEERQVSEVNSATPACSPPTLPKPSFSIVIPSCAGLLFPVAIPPELEYFYPDLLPSLQEKMTLGASHRQVPSPHPSTASSKSSAGACMALLFGVDAVKDGETAKKVDIPFSGMPFIGGFGGKGKGEGVLYKAHLLQETTLNRGGGKGGSLHEVHMDDETMPCVKDEKAVSSHGISKPRNPSSYASMSTHSASTLLYSPSDMALYLALLRFTSLYKLQELRGETENRYSVQSIIFSPVTGVPTVVSFFYRYRHAGCPLMWMKMDVLGASKAALGAMSSVEDGQDDTNESNNSDSEEEEDGREEEENHSKKGRQNGSSASSSSSHFEESQSCSSSDLEENEPFIIFQAGMGRVEVDIAPKVSLSTLHLLLRLLALPPSFPLSLLWNVLVYASMLTIPIWKDYGQNFFSLYKHSFTDEVMKIIAQETKKTAEEDRRRKEENIIF